jgi:hypothetical protein
MIQASVWLSAYSDAMRKEILLTNAALPWYEIDQSLEVIPDRGAELEFIIKPIMTKELLIEKRTIKPLPDRPNRMTRLSINLTFTDKTTAKVIVKDLGFGDFYPESGGIWEYTFEIG